MILILKAWLYTQHPSLTLTKLTLTKLTKLVLLHNHPWSNHQLYKILLFKKANVCEEQQDHYCKSWLS